MNARDIIRARLSTHTIPKITDIEKVKSGTTLIGFLFDNGKCALMAADRMTSDGWHVYSPTSKKIHAIGKNVLVSGTGTVAVIQQLIDYLKTCSNALSNETGTELSAKGKANLFLTILRAVGGYEAQFILAGRDYLKGMFINNFDCGGGVYTSAYICDGCGRDHAEDVLDNAWKPSLRQDEAILLAIKALVQAGKRSPFSGHPFISPVHIALMDEDGITWVKEKAIEKIIKRCVPEYFKRQKANEIEED